MFELSGRRGDPLLARVIPSTPAGSEEGQKKITRRLSSGRVEMKSCGSPDLRRSGCIAQRCLKMAGGGRPTPEYMLVNEWRRSKSAFFRQRGKGEGERQRARRQVQFTGLYLGYM